MQPELFTSAFPARRRGLPLTARVAQHRWAGVAIHAALVAVIAVLLSSTDPRRVLLIGGTLSAVVLPFLGCVEFRRAPLKLSPISFLLFWQAVGLGLAAIHTAYRIGANERIQLSAAVVAPNHIALGYVVFHVGIVALHLGLEWARPHASAGGYVRRTGPLDLRWLVVMWAAGIVYLTHQSWFEPIGTPAKPLMWTGLAALACFSLLGREYFRLTPAKFYLILGTGLLGLLYGNSFTGSKSYLSFSFLPLVWMVLWRGKSRGWLLPLGVALALIYLGLIAPTVVTYRAARQTAHPLTELDAAHAVLQGRSADDVSMGDRVDSFLDREFEALSCGFIAGEIERSGLRWGETMDYAKYAFIPRILWPNKPGVTRGAWFTVYLGFAPREAEAGTSTGITAIGELYWNFGVPGAIVGMIAAGLLLGLLWRMAGVYPLQRPLHMLLYVMVMVAGMTELPEAVTVYAATISELLIFSALFLILSASEARMQRYAMPVRPS